MINYFEKYGADPCPKKQIQQNGCYKSLVLHQDLMPKQDYFEVWRNSSEYQAVREEINRMEAELSKLPRDNDPEALLKYAAPLWKQYLLVSWRTIVQDWRSPGYIYSKLIVVISAALFIGFSFFKSKNNIQGLQNQMFSVFMFFIPFNTLVATNVTIFCET